MSGQCAFALAARVAFRSVALSGKCLLCLLILHPHCFIFLLLLPLPPPFHKTNQRMSCKPEFPSPPSRLLLSTSALLPLLYCTNPFLNYNFQQLFFFFPATNIILGNILCLIHVCVCLVENGSSNTGFTCWRCAGRPRRCIKSVKFLATLKRCDV